MSRACHTSEVLQQCSIPRPWAADVLLELSKAGFNVQAGIEDASGFIMFPLVVHSMDLVVSAIGIMSIGDKPSSKPGQAVEDPYEVLKVRQNHPRPSCLCWLPLSGQWRVVVHVAMVEVLESGKLQRVFCE